MRPANSMIEFKQILGRGSSLFDGKKYFAIYVFLKAYEYFNDPGWDGERAEPEPVAPRSGIDEPPSPIYGDDGVELARPKKIKVKLAGGQERTI